MKKSRMNQIEREIKKLRESINDDTDTALAIDRNDPWGDIARLARRDGYDELADICQQADAEWDD